MVTNCSASGSNTGSGFYFDGVSGQKSPVHAKISNCISHNNREIISAGTACGFRLRNITDITITDCDASLNGRYGFSYENVDNVVHSLGKVRENAKDAGVQGIRTVNCHNMQFINVHSIKSGSLPPMAILSGCTNVTVDGGYFDQPIMLQDGVGYYRPTQNRALIRLSHDGSYTLDGTNHFISGVVSDSYGIRINFRNLPVGVTPTVIPVHASSTGLAAAKTVITHMYVRSTDYRTCVIGLKGDLDPATPHRALAVCDTGVVVISVTI